jgi:hypothetical protein
MGRSALVEEGVEHIDRIDMEPGTHDHAMAPKLGRLPEEVAVDAVPSRRLGGTQVAWRER